MGDTGRGRARVGGGGERKGGFNIAPARECCCCCGGALQSLYRSLRSGHVNFAEYAAATVRTDGRTDGQTDERTDSCMGSAQKGRTDGRTGATRINGGRRPTPVSPPFTFIHSFSTPYSPVYIIGKSVLSDALASPIAGRISDRTREIHVRGGRLIGSDRRGRIKLCFVYCTRLDIKLSNGR